MKSGNYLVDMLEDEELLVRGEKYCSDCKHSPCTCDEEYERFKEERGD